MANSRFRVFSFLVMSLSVAMMLAAGISLVYTVGPWVETTYFPVTSKLVIADLRAGPVPGTSEFTAEFTRSPRACQYIGIGWFSTDDGGLGGQRVHITQMHSAVGSSDAHGPWIVELPPDKIAGHSRVELYYMCHPFWLTTTDFYP